MYRNRATNVNKVRSYIIYTLSYRLVITITNKKEKREKKILKRTRQPHLFVQSFRIVDWAKSITGGTIYRVCITLLGHVIATLQCHFLLRLTHGTARKPPKVQRNNINFLLPNLGGGLKGGWSKQCTYMRTI